MNDDPIMPEPTRVLHVPDPPSPPDPVDPERVDMIPPMLIDQAVESQPRLTPAEATTAPSSPTAEADMPKKEVKIEMDGATVTVEVPEPLKRKCKIEDVLPASVLQLVKSAPQNETIRNVLLAHLKIPVPPELKTFNDIKDWVEFNIDPPKSAWDQECERIEANNRNRIMVHIQANDREHGSCNYSEDLRGDGSVPLEPDEILEAAEEASNLDEFWRNIRNAIMENDPRDHVFMDPVEGSQNYTDHESSDHDGIEVVIQPEGYRVLRQALRNISPDNASRLGA